MWTLSVENICERLANEEQKILKPSTLGGKIHYFIKLKIVHVRGWK